MRDIKFRAWYAPKPCNEWDAVIAPRMIYFDMAGYCDEYNHLSFDLSEISTNPDGGDYCNLGANFKEFSPLMQYTGLKDRNGKEIYEGDIVCHPNPECRGAVKFGIYKGGSYDTYEDGNGFYVDRIDSHPEGLHEDGYFVIIGNIYQNPELLKET